MKFDKSVLPAAFLQREVSPRMSDRYVNVCTADVIDVMEEQGFQLTDYKVDKAYKRADEAQYGRHVAIFRHPDLQGHTGGYVPQMLWINSHNGKTPAVMRFGLYRFVCANGLVIGNDMLSARVKHMGVLAEQIIERVKLFHEEQTPIYKAIDDWSSILLPRSQQIAFAKEAAKMRFGEDKAQQYNPESFLEVKRAEDDRADLWMVYNRIQEHTVKGGVAGRNANNRNVRTKELKAIGLDMDYNTALWNLAERIAEGHKPMTIQVPASYTAEAIDVQARVIA